MFSDYNLLLGVLLQKASDTYDQNSLTFCHYFTHGVECLEPPSRSPALQGTLSGCCFLCWNGAIEGTLSSLHWLGPKEGTLFCFLNWKGTIAKNH